MNEKQTPWEKAARRIADIPKWRGLSLLSKNPTWVKVIKTACEEHAAKKDAQIAELLEENRQLREGKPIGAVVGAMALVEGTQCISEERDALLAENARLRSAIEGPIQRVCYDVLQYGCLGEALQRAIDAALHPQRPDPANPQPTEPTP